MITPLVTVIVPCYNQGIFLSEALDSVSNQIYQNWECIIVNDGGTDETKSIAEEYFERDERFKYLEQENGGVSKARNLGIAEGKGVYILPLDADDRISRDYLLLAVKAFENNPFLKIVYCRAEKFGDEQGEWILPPFSKKDLAKGNIIFSSAFFKRTDWETINGYDETMLIGLEDWDFWITLLKDGGEVKKLEIIGFYYRIKASSRNKNLDPGKFEVIENYVNIKHPKFFVEELGSSIKLHRQIGFVKRENLEMLKSEKFLFHSFLKTVFGISIFRKYR